MLSFDSMCIRLSHVYKIFCLFVVKNKSNFAAGDIQSLNSDFDGKFEKDFVNKFLFSLVVCVCCDITSNESTSAFMVSSVMHGRVLVVSPWSSETSSSNVFF